jgi:two-component system, OmpR family, response regulator
MKVLVVEDEHKIANSIKQGLEQEKFVVDLAFDGQEGLDLASSEAYDVIILDRMLPLTSGDKILQEIRIKNIHTPVLMLTAKGQVEDKVEGLNSGADDYLTKPFAFSELIARLKALNRRPQNTFKEELIIEDLSLNTQSFEVKRGKTPINLSSKEFSLLEFLMRHPRKIIKKDQIIMNVWSYESDILPNSVEVYIKHLRDKIDKPFKDQPQLIHTVRGFGYKIG